RPPGVGALEVRPRRGTDRAGCEDPRRGEQVAGEVPSGDVLLAARGDRELVPPQRGAVGVAAAEARQLRGRTRPARRSVGGGHAPPSSVPKGSPCQRAAASPAMTSIGPRAASSTTVATWVATGCDPNRNSWISSPRRLAWNSAGVPNQRASL